MAKRGLPNTTITSTEPVTASSEAWNVADGYTKLKILRQLLQLDRYQLIAQYGYEDMDGDAIPDDNSTPNLIAQRRYEAMRRWASAMKQLLGNTKFALKKDDKIRWKIFFKRASAVEKYLEAMIITHENYVTKETTLTINEEHFEKCFEILESLKNDINEPLNRAGLIFRESEEIDLDKLSSQIIEGG